MKNIAIIVLVTLLVGCKKHSAPPPGSEIWCDSNGRYVFTVDGYPWNFESDISTNKQFVIDKAWSYYNFTKSRRVIKTHPMIQSDWHKCE